MSELPADLPDVQMVQCDITGRTVPLDETIELHGYRVCAEGKQILLDRLKAGEAMPGELERSSFWRRFGAYFIDGLIFGALSGCVGGGVGGALAATDNMAMFLAVTTFLQLLVVLAQLSYFALLHAKYGQTWGKMAVKIKVVQPDGSDITTGQAWKRSFFYIGPQVVLLAVSFLIALLAPPSPTTQVVANVIVVPGALYILASIITALVDRQQQRAIHDYVAGTRVIRLP
ncbi:MAG: RDD family protein [Phycisphaeraceae bacterium]